MDIFSIGDTVRLSASFTRTNNNALADPDTITLLVIRPKTGRSTYTYGDGILLRDGVGLYHADLDLDINGTWTWRFEGTGAVPSASEASFSVTASRFY